MATRTEVDEFGQVEVPANHLWGATTQRAINNFRISTELIPREVIVAIAEIKKAAAIVNAKLGDLEQEKANAIVAAAEEIIKGEHFDEFPLHIWQTGSGTQTNQNVNEVIANIASKKMGGPIGQFKLVHPNDDVNKYQSSNDVFSSAMHIAALETLQLKLIPAVTQLRDTILRKSDDFDNIIKNGRTHLQDATPLTLGQEFSGYATQLDIALKCLYHNLESLYELAIGATGVGTGMGSPTQFNLDVIEELKKINAIPFKPARNMFSAISSHEPLVFAHSSLKTLASSMFKIANDIRWLASGPRSGLGEISIPANEPGSSIMPGKVNPTQSEAMTMVVTRVFGNDVTVNMAGASGNFELNCYKPVIIYTFMQSVRLMADSCRTFNDNCAIGITPNRERITELMNRSLMLVTSLAPHIGYDRAAKIAKYADKNNLTLKQAALKLNELSEVEFDEWVNPAKMIGRI